ncbi:MAG: acyltransferase [Rhizobiaceae bacterium]
MSVYASTARPRAASDRLSAFAAKDANSYGVVRLAAALAVIFTHAFGVVGGWEAPEPLAALTGWSIAAHAVHVFFALSGFMIAASWERSAGWLDFFAARLLRIMPALIVVNIAIVIAGGVWLTSAAPSDYWTVANVGTFLARTVLLFSVGVGLDGVFTNNPMSGSVNIPIWTIRFEVICYITLMVFMAALAVLRLRGQARLIPLAPVIAVSAIVVTVSGDPEHFGFAAQLARFTSIFYLGVAFWIARDIVPIRRDIALALALPVALAVWSELPLRYPVMIAATAYWSFWLGSLKMGRIQRWASATDLSYGVYIMGFFIQQWLAEAMPGMTVMQNALLAALLATAAAWISWTYIEKPAMTLRRVRARKSRAPAAMAGPPMIERRAAIR